MSYPQSPDVLVRYLFSHGYEGTRFFNGRIIFRDWTGDGTWEDGLADVNGWVREDNGVCCYETQRKSKIAKCLIEGMTRNAPRPRTNIPRSSAILSDTICRITVAGRPRFAPSSRLAVKYSPKSAASCKNVPIVRMNEYIPNCSTEIIRTVSAVTPRPSANTKIRLAAAKTALKKIDCPIYKNTGRTTTRRSLPSPMLCVTTSL